MGNDQSMYESFEKHASFRNDKTDLENDASTLNKMNRMTRMQHAEQKLSGQPVLMKMSSPESSTDQSGQKTFKTGMKMDNDVTQGKTKKAVKATAVVDDFSQLEPVPK